MPTIQFSSMIDDESALGLSNFMSQTRNQVNFIVFDWSQAWDEMLSIGLHNRGPDISQMGTTWLGSLVGMQSLQAFTDKQIERVGGKEIFFDAAWQGNQLPGSDQEYAIPWILDTRNLLYRRDWLEKAGVDETKAFATPKAMEQTLEKLVRVGCPIPFATPTNDEVIHSAAPWIWRLGGSLRSKDRHTLAFRNKKTIQGLTEYFNLAKYLVPEARGMNNRQVGELFKQGKVAVAYTIHNVVSELCLLEPPEFGLENFGAASPPGIPFIGGSGLVLWQHSVQDHTAVELIRHLCSREVQKQIYLSTQNLPARTDVLEQEPFTNYPQLQAILNNLKTGKALQSSRQWATIEARVNGVLNQLWVDIFKNPDLSIPEQIDQRINKLSDSIEKTLLTS